MLQAVLRTAKFMPRGFTFEGVHGIGRTTTALILARALMCTGDDPLGCGKCPSCLTAKESADLSTHPDFKMCAAAQYQTADKARELLDVLSIPPRTGKRNVLLVEESQRFSKEAWDIFLAPLEKDDTQSIFIFSTTEPDKLPVTIRSRCCQLRFSRLSLEMIRGLLINKANLNSIQFERDAIDLIARRSRGYAREALSMLNTVAGMGTVTKSLVASVMDNSLEEGCLRVLLLLLTKEIKDAVQEMDKLTLAFLPTQILEAFFALLGKIAYGDVPIDPEEQQAYAVVQQSLPDLSPVTSLLLKWISANYLPADAMAIFVEEFAQVREGKSHQPAERMQRTLSGTAARQQQDSNAPLSADEIFKILNAEKVNV